MVSCKQAPYELLVGIEEVEKFVGIDFLGGSEDNHLKVGGHHLKELSEARTSLDVHLQSGRRVQRA